MDNKSNLTKYGVLAVFYDAVFTPFFGVSRKKNMEILKAASGDRVLLVGVGTGLDLPFFPAGAAVTGVDISESMLARARRKKIQAGAELLSMNAERLEFKDNVFDKVMMNLILSVVEHPRAAMAEALRVLKPGGVMLVWDKFSASKKPGSARKILNVITSFIGTDITRNFEEISEGCKFEVLSDTAGMFGGNYRTILLKKT
jgi:phosphatidylethanolamine/phosphatidyl-N-methylethanolamine N-methyltransferase